jgi:alpha/beta superfamily hydrolase
MSVLTFPPDGSGKNKPTPGIVLCHGPGGYGILELTEQDSLMINVANWLAQEGYASLRFYYRGVGESEGPLYRLIPMEQVEDIRNAISFIQVQNGVDPDRIGLLGAAIGGSHASYVAAIDERVKCMVSINGMGNWGRWLKSMRSDQEWQEFLRRVQTDSRSRVITGKPENVNLQEVILPDPETREERKQLLKENPALAGNLVSLDSAVAMMDYRPEDYVSRISPRAAMWIGSAGDALVPNLEPETMFRNARAPKKLELVQGEAHHGLYRGKGFETMMHLATKWFDSYLK